MKDANHPSDALLFRYMDGELGEQEQAAASLHLAVCDSCRRKRDKFVQLSFRVEALMGAQAVGAGDAARAKLAAALNSQAASAPKVMKRFAWGMALAATLAIGIVLAPRPQTKPAQVIRTLRPVANAIQTTSFDVNGESFIALPYSNPELPMNAPRIVEMQVPVSSLASAGIFFQPVASTGVGERTVLANVLLGMDGQPLGVHVLSVE